MLRVGISVRPFASQMGTCWMSWLVTNDVPISIIKVHIPVYLGIAFDSSTSLMATQSFIPEPSPIVLALTYLRLFYLVKAGREAGKRLERGWELKIKGPKAV